MFTPPLMSEALKVKIKKDSFISKRENKKSVLQCTHTYTILAIHKN